LASEKGNYFSEHSVANIVLHSGPVLLYNFCNENFFDRNRLFETFNRSKFGKSFPFPTVEGECQKILQSV
jgi:hypothetical protein